MAELDRSHEQMSDTYIIFSFNAWTIPQETDGSELESKERKTDDGVIMNRNVLL